MSVKALLGISACSLGAVHGDSVVHGCAPPSAACPVETGHRGGHLDPGYSLVSVPPPPLSDCLLHALEKWSCVPPYLTCACVSCLCSTGGFLMMMIQCVQIVATRKSFVVPESKELKGLALTNRYVRVCVHLLMSLSMLTVLPKK